MLKDKNTSKSVLIVEDDFAIRQMYSMKLRLSGYTIYEAVNGEEGYEIAKKLLPDLILLDLRMPVMTGDQMLVKLREEKWGEEIHIIVLTNISKNEAPSILRFLNVDRYIVKAHCTPSQLLEVVGEVFV